MSLEAISSIKNKLKKFLKDKEILDVILFGSLIKGKAVPGDIDAAIITDKKIQCELKGFHISVINPKEFFINPPTIINTLLREGYSLKNSKFLSKAYRFSNKIMFVYELKDLKASDKVKIVNILRGIKQSKGMVEMNGGEWLANRVFTAPVEAGSIIEKFLINQKVRFRKFNILIH